MTHINTFGICRALNIDTKEYEDKIEGLRYRLETSHDLNVLASVKNCLTVMKRIGSGYGLRRTSTYYSASRLLFNLESLLIRLMCSTTDSVEIDIIRLQNILNRAAELNYFENTADIAIGHRPIMVGIGSSYFYHLLHMNYTEVEITKMKQNLSRPDSRLRSLASETEINAILNKLNRFIYHDVHESIREKGSFYKLLKTLTLYKSGTYASKELDPLVSKLTKARNATSHTGKIVLDATNMAEILKAAFTFLAIAAACNKRPNLRAINRITFGLLNPMEGFDLLMPYIRILFYVFVVLILIWTFAPMPKPQRMTYGIICSGGKLEELYEAFAKKDTDAALRIHEEGKIIGETLEAIE